VKVLNVDGEPAPTVGELYVHLAETQCLMALEGYELHEHLLFGPVAIAELVGGGHIMTTAQRVGTWTGTAFAPAHAREAS